MNRFIQREYFEDELATMLGSLDVGALESILRKSSNSDFTIPKEKRNRQGITELLRNQSSLDRNQILEELYRSEANKPFKHTLLSTFTGSHDKISESILGCEFGMDTPVGRVSGFRCSFYEDKEDFVNLTIEHTDDSIHYYYADGGRFSRDVLVRHPFVVTISKKARILLVNYPGYSRKEMSGYSDLLQEIVSILDQEFLLGITALPIKKVIEAFLERKTPRFVFDDVKGRSINGSFNLSSNQKGFSVDDLLPAMMAEFLVKYSTDEIRDALVGAIKKCNETSEVLFWNDESVYTGLNYYSFGTELYFTWKGVAPNYKKVWSITKFLLSVSSGFEAKTNILSHLLSLSRDSLITREIIVSRTGFKEKDVTEQIAKYVSDGLLLPVYKLNSNSKFINPSLNKWFGTLDELIKAYEEQQTEVELSSKDRQDILRDIELAFCFDNTRDLNEAP